MSCAIGKFSILRCVCAPQYTCAGTFTSPMVSFSILNSICWFLTVYDLSICLQNLPYVFLRKQKYLLSYLLFQSNCRIQQSQRCIHLHFLCTLHSHSVCNLQQPMELSR